MPLLPEEEIERRQAEILARGESTISLDDVLYIFGYTREELRQHPAYWGYDEPVRPAYRAEDDPIWKTGVHVRFRR